MKRSAIEAGAALLAPRQHPLRRYPAPPAWRPAPGACDQLMDDPRLAQAVYDVSGRMEGAFASNRVLSITMNNRARFLISLLVMALDAAPEGLTVNRFKALCAEEGICSPGRARAALILLRFAGMLEPEAEPRPGRARRLLPLPLLRREHEERLARWVRAAAMVRPALAPLVPRLGDPAALSAMTFHLMRSFCEGARPVEHIDPVFRGYVEHQGFLLLLLGLVPASTGPDGAPLREPALASARALAGRYALSHSQTVTMLRQAVEAGYVVHAQRAESRGYHLTPGGLRMLHRFFGVIFLMMEDALAPLARGGEG